MVRYYLKGIFKIAEWIQIYSLLADKKLKLMRIASLRPHKTMEEAWGRVILNSNPITIGFIN